MHPGSIIIDDNNSAKSEVVTYVLMKPAVSFYMTSHCRRSEP